MWLVLTSYKRNRRKYLYVILSLMLTTFLATISISSLEFAASVWRKPLLMMWGGHMLLYPFDNTDMNPQHLPSRVFDVERASEIVKDVFPEASTTPQLIVPVTSDTDSAPWRRIVGRSDNLDLWYLAPETRDGLPLASVPAEEPTIVCDGFYVGMRPLPAPVAIRVAEYVGGDHPWELTGVETRKLTSVGTMRSGSGDYAIYMRLEALRSITGCPSNMISLLGIALPGMQYKVDPRRVEQLRTRLSHEMPGVAVTTPEEIAERMVASMGILRDTPRKYLPVVYAISFMVVAAIVTSIVDSRRRELRMLHVIGSNRIQVRALFAVECMIAATTAGLIGYLPLWLLGRFVLGTTQISLLPLLITLSGASLIAVLRSAFLLNENTSGEVSM